MSLPPQVWDTAGNLEYLDGVQLSYDSMTNVAVPVATRPAILCGTGAPTFTAPKGSLFINLTGSSTITRLYVNTTGSTTWTPFTAGA